MAKRDVIKVFDFGKMIDIDHLIFGRANDVLDDEKLACVMSGLLGTEKDSFRLVVSIDIDGSIGLSFNEQIYGLHDIESNNELVATLFPSFINVETFRDFQQSLVNLKEILLLGEFFDVNVKSGSLQLMKMSAVNLYQDVCSHILPKFQKETKYNLMGMSIAGKVDNENKLLNNISPDFLTSLTDSDVAEALLNILLALYFEEEIFS